RPSVASTIRSDSSSILVAHTQLRERLGRAAGPLGDDGVAHVLEVVDTDAAGPEAAGGQVPEAGEERNTLGKLRPRTRGPRDVIEDRGPLHIGDLEEPIAEARARLALEPRESAAHRR